MSKSPIIDEIINTLKKKGYSVNNRKGISTYRQFKANKDREYMREYRRVKEILKNK